MKMGVMYSLSMKLAFSEFKVDTFTESKQYPWNEKQCFRFVTHCQNWKSCMLIFSR